MGTREKLKNMPHNGVGALVHTWLLRLFLCIHDLHIPVYSISITSSSLFYPSCFQKRVLQSTTPRLLVCYLILEYTSSETQS
jgi:hypothetical protein